MWILIIIRIFLLSNVAAAYKWRDHEKTNKRFLNDHMDVIGVMKQMHHHLSKIEDLINDKKSIRGNQICMFKFIDSTWYIIL